MFLQQYCRQAVVQIVELNKSLSETSTIALCTVDGEFARYALGCAHMGEALLDWLDQAKKFLERAKDTANLDERAAHLEVATHLLERFIASLETNQ